MSAWTPGPWQRVGWKPCGIYGPGDLANAERVCRMDARQEHDANANLIAAAPDLAEALEKWLAADDGWYETLDRDAGEAEASLDSAKIAARAAVAKARGEA